MCLYLTKRGATYYFRRAIPDELQPAFGGKTEFTFSLRTKDKEEAKRKRSLEALRTDKELEDAEARLAGRLVATPAPRASERPPEEWEIAAFEAEGREAVAQDDRREELSEAIKFLEERLRGSTREMPPELRAFAYLLRGREFDTELLRDQLTKARAEKQALERRLVGQDERPSPAPPEAPQGRNRSGGAAVPLLDIFDAYAAAQGIKPGTTKEWRARMRDLIAFLGHDDAARITEDDVRRWRDHLLSEKVNGDRTRDPRTVRSTYISALRATLNWAKEEGKLASNVAASVVVRVPKKPKLRDRDFTADEAKRILKASLQTDASLSEERAFARRWIPWLCAYTGGRVNEFSQLRREDVKQTDGTWVVTITPEAGTVKANAARTVPLHPHLVEQGFPAAVQAKPEGPLFYNPDKQRVVGGDTRHFKKVGERLAAWVRKDVGISDPNVQPNHAWRHLFKSIALASGMPERIADYIQGHAAKTVGRTYGSVPLNALSDAIEKLPRFQV